MHEAESCAENARGWEALRFNRSYENHIGQTTRGQVKIYKRIASQIQVGGGEHSASYYTSVFCCRLTVCVADLLPLVFGLSDHNPWLRFNQLSVSVQPVIGFIYYRLFLTVLRLNSPCWVPFTRYVWAVRKPGPRNIYFRVKPLQHSWNLYPHLSTRGYSFDKLF